MRISASAALLTASLLASTITTAAPTAPAAAADTKIGFVNVSRILRDSPMAIKLSKKLEKDFAPREAELKKAIQELKARQTDFEKDAMTLSESDRNKRQQAIVADQRELGRKKQDFQEQLHQARNDAVGQLQDKARKAVLDIAEKDHFDLIIEEASVIFASHKIDITDRVMKQLDK